MDVLATIPIDTADVKSPEQVGELVELLGQHIHSKWIEEGLRSVEGDDAGPVPNDDLPALGEAPYLTAALETLKAVCALGFRIEKSMDTFSSSSGTDAGSLLKRLMDPSPMGLFELRAL